MAATKARTSLWSNQTLTAGAGLIASSSVDLSTGYGAQLDIVLTNGAIGPTVPVQVQVQVAASNPAALWTNFGGPLIGSTANLGTSDWSIELPIGAASVRIFAGSNTGQDVTIDADISNVTGL